ncbi:MAG: ABC transporter substrate-binding protein, partial [Pseudomonadota bacterium]
MAHLLPRLMRVGMAICLIAILAGHGSAGAEERLALVISNQDYPVEVGRLGKTHEDGRLVAEALKSVGFKVEVVRDADKAVMQLAVAEYISRLARAGPSAVGFFYYSGHGAASSKDGPNFLIPTSAPLTDGAQLPFLAIELGDIVAALSKTSAKANFVVVDACRNVPFTRSDKSAHKGFRPENGRSGVMIAYATDPGNVAVDENVYARALAREIPVANRPAVLMFRAVRRAVLNATGNKQHPWTRDGLVNDFFFKRAAVSPAPPVTDTEPAPKPQLEFDTRALDLAFWNQIENSQNPEDFEDYLKHFPNGTFKRFALRRLEELQKVVADVLPPDAPKPPVRLRPAPPGTVHFIPQHAYRTGPFGGMGTPLADGFHDYLAMLNERDGGIGGVPLKPEECETGYNAQRGVDCYLETKSRNPLVYNPLSTGISLQLIPRAEKDKVPVLTSGYGLSAVADGELFPWIFNFPSVYWHRMTSIISYIRSQGGIRGRKIAFLYLNVGYGREPIALLEEIAREVGFELLKVPVGVKEMQDQSAQWLQIRKERPDWIIMWSWGVMTT